MAIEDLVGLRDVVFAVYTFGLKVVDFRYIRSPSRPKSYNFVMKRGFKKERKVQNSSVGFLLLIHFSGEGKKDRATVASKTENIHDLRKGVIEQSSILTEGALSRSM